MRLNKISVASIAFGMTALLGSTFANADSIQQTGWSVGVPLGSQFPEGVYFANLFSAGGFRGVDDTHSNLEVNVPLIYWSTPWSIFNGKLAVLATAPLASFELPAPVYSGTQYLLAYNPAVVAGPVWDLGDGWGLSTFVGLWFPVDNFLGQLGHDEYTFTQLINIAYVKDGWKLAANLTYGITGDDQNTNQKVKPDYFNYDLTATKTIGKWEVGLASFGSADISGTSNPGYAKQAQFALGGLIGYDFGPFSTQFYATTDVYSHNYYNLDGSKSYETRFWNRVVIPLWKPEAVALK